MTERPFVIGITGSIGMGKTTTSAMFREEGIPVWSADNSVAALYETGGAAVEPVGAICPEAVKNGWIDKSVLRDAIARDGHVIGLIEKAVHPLVASDRERFIDAAGRAGHPLVVVEIPLLYETGAGESVDFVVVTSVPCDIQRSRVLARKGMTRGRFEHMLARQMPDSDKRRLADLIIDTSSMDTARAEVTRLLETLTGEENKS